MRPGLQVFLCHASDDKLAARALYRALCAVDGVEPWLDEENLLPGQDWALEIRRAVQNSHAIIVCLSTISTRKEGYVQREIAQALDLAEEKPEGTIFLIPVKLEQCDVPTTLRSRQWIHLGDETGFERLIAALRRRAQQLDIVVGDFSSDQRSKLFPLPQGIRRADVPRKGVILPFTRKSIARDSLDLEFSPLAPQLPRTLKATIEAVIYCDVAVATLLHRSIGAFLNGALITIIVGGVICVGWLSRPKAVSLTSICMAYVAVWILYSMFFALTDRDTPGVYSVGLRLVNFNGFRAQRSQRFIRFVGTLLSVGACWLGVLWVLIDEESLAWHDHLSKTFPTLRQSGSVSE